jgi:hypothetical protein
MMIILNQLFGNNISKKYLLPALLSVLCGCNQNTQLKKNTLSKAELDSILENHYNNDQFEKVIYIAGSLLSLDSNNGSYYYKKAVSFAFFQDYDSSNYYFLKSASKGFRQKDCYYAVGMRYHYNYMDSICLVYLEKAISIDSNDALLQKARNDIQYLLKNNDETRVTYKNNQ